LKGEYLTDVYYFALLYHLGCTASADRQAQVSAGDDVSSRRSFSEADYTDCGELLRLAATRVARDWGPLARAQAVAGLLTAPKDLIVEAYAAICEVAGIHRGPTSSGAPILAQAPTQDGGSRWSPQKKG
jgi:hypothetical protein